MLVVFLPGCSLLFDSGGGDGRDAGDIVDGNAQTEDARGDSGLPALGPIVTLTDSSSSAINSSVSFGGGDFQVVWEDYKSSAMPEIYGATVGSGGPVAITSGGGTEPTSVWVDDKLVVAWSSGTSLQRPIRVGLYGADFARIGNELTMPAQGAGDNFTPSIILAASQVGMTWALDDGTDRLVFAALNNVGVVVSAPDKFQAEASSPSIAYNGSNYGIAWYQVENKEIHFSIQSGSNAFVPTKLTQSGIKPARPVTAANDGVFAVVWEQEDTAGNTSSLWFTSVDPDGSFPTPVMITASTSKEQRLFSFATSPPYQTRVVEVSATAGVSCDEG